MAQRKAFFEQTQKILHRRRKNREKCFFCKKRRNVANLVIFASGSGTNAERIITYFAQREDIVVRLVFSNRADAFVLKRAARLNVPCEVFGRADFYDSPRIMQRLQELETDWIILAGFLWKVPDAIVQAYAGRIINIHPALLPAYGGRGMYGHHVHQAVIDHHEKESGITVHYVDDQYDHGRIIMQARCPVYETDTPDTLAARIHHLEYAYFPVAIAQAIESASAGK